jgi:hypothetical protein
MAPLSSPRRKCFSTETISRPAKSTAKTEKTSARHSLFQQTQKLYPTGKIDTDTWNAFAPASSASVLKRYIISEDDVAGPFERQIPRRLEQMAKLPGLPYRSPLEELSEKFHMSESLYALSIRARTLIAPVQL